MEAKDVRMWIFSARRARARAGSACPAGALRLSPAAGDEVEVKVDVIISRV
jgi:hypothetical protein